MTDSFASMLRCPVCREGTLDLRENGRAMLCLECGENYPVVNGRPVLLRPDNELFCRDDYIKAGAVSTADGTSSVFTRVVPSPSMNLASSRVLERLKLMLGAREKPQVLVVGGGEQRAWLEDSLSGNAVVHIVYSDIDARADVDIYCDGHDLPFLDSAFDAVITTAVLEHVMYPEQVAAEIHRVLKAKGLLYSELPFIQQVHEGAYDFTRYTLSGHRRLFNHFE